MSNKYIISIDQSTQGTKAILLNKDGNIVHKCSREHQQITNDKGWVSHNPEEIYQNVLAVIKEIVETNELSAKSIKAVGITNQRETSLIWQRETGKLIDNAIVWQCSRAKDITARIKDEKTIKYVLENSGLQLSPYFPAAKYAWLFENYQLDKQMANGELCCGTVDSYLIYRLTNKEVFKSDYSNASRTQLFNIKTLDWDDELCKLFHINKECLPEVIDSDSMFGTTDFAGILDDKVAIYAVMGDSHAALYGQGCWNKGETKATYGTGSSIMMNTGNELKHSKNGLATSIAWKINEKVDYVLEGNINYTGAVISWLIKDLKLINNPNETEELALKANGADQTYLVPAFSGLGAPYWKSDVTAILMGMTRITGKNEIVRAAVDSIAYQINDVIEIMKSESDLDLTRLCVDGGPTVNKYLMQFQSDIANIPIYISNYAELSAIGVGLLAGIKSGLYDKSVIEDIKYQRIYPKMDQQERSNKIAGWKRSVQLTIGESNK